MKQIITILIFILSASQSIAQNGNPAVTMDEVTVKGAKIVSKVDGQMIYPTDAQKKTSNNGYSILQKLSLPNLRIVGNSISAIDSRGEVQIRINNIIVGKQEMLALDPKLITKIDYIDTPGVRYGEGVAYVINIFTKRNDSGCTLGADLTPTLTSWQGDGMAYGKWNTGKNELSASYSFSGHQLDGVEAHEVADYTLSDGNIRTIERNDVETLRKALSHDIKLTYNYTDSTTSVFQISMSQNIGNTPGNYSIKDVFDGMSRQTAAYRNSARSSSPVFDVYMFRQFTPSQSLTANAVGTYIHTNTRNSFDEQASYQYAVRGRTASALSEAVYENCLKPFTLSAGINYRYKYTNNDYVGSTDALTRMSQNNLYGFAEIKGSLKDFRYSLGLGSSYIRYCQNEHNYDFWTFRPKMSLAYNLIDGMQLNYTFEMSDRASRIAMINDATIQTNSMEYTVGNPDLKPSRDTEHSLRLSYNNNRWSSFMDGFYRHCNKPNMAYYERTAEDKFMYTQINQKEIDLLRVSAYASYWILPEKLQAAAYGGMQRCFNYGYDYSHFYSSWFYVGNITAYLGKFTLQAYVDNGSRFLEGETKGYSGAYSALRASYMHGDWQFSLTWANPLTNNYKSNEAEILNCNLHKFTTIYERNSGNQLIANVSWRLSRGKKHQSAHKTINLSDTDDGIIR